MIFFKIILFLQLASVIMGTSNMERKILDQIFSPANYDKRIRPRLNGTGTSPLNVTVSLYILSLTLSSEEEQSYNVDMFFREEWIDDRLKFDNYNGKVLTINTLENLWMPDLFFVNEIKGHSHSITVPNVFVRIWPQGRVFLSTRLNLQLSADFDYRKFPFDTQELPIRIESYGYQQDEITLNWVEYNPVPINKNVEIPLFCIDKWETIADTVSVNTGTYSYLTLKFTVHRRFNYYLVHVFIPCTMFVIVAYFSLWLNSKFVTERVILSAASLFTLSMTANDLNNQFPKSSYTKLVDVYTGVSLTFVFATLVEVVVAQAYENSRRPGGTSEEQDQNAHSKSFNVKHMKQWLKSTPLNKVDAVFRIVYPITFSAFLVVYAIAALI